MRSIIPCKGDETDACVPASMTDDPKLIYVSTETLFLDNKAVLTTLFALLFRVCILIINLIVFFYSSSSGIALVRTTYGNLICH